MRTRPGCPSLTDGATSYITGPGGLPIEQVTANGQVRYYHHDHQGSVAALTDQAGTKVAGYTYSAYGQQTTTTGAEVTNPFGYAGQYTDQETGLQYLRARMYDPVTGQFLTKDPLGAQTGQPYAYAGNDPANYADPTGLLLGIPGTPSLESIVQTVSTVASVASSVTGGCAAVLFWTPVGAACATVSTAAGLTVRLVWRPSETAPGTRSPPTPPAPDSEFSAARCSSGAGLSLAVDVRLCRRVGSSRPREAVPGSARASRSGRQARFSMPALSRCRTPAHSKDTRPTRSPTAEHDALRADTADA